jgi:DMSO reductase family type II enzyme heme b subunit
MRRRSSWSGAVLAVMAVGVVAACAEQPAPAADVVAVRLPMGHRLDDPEARFWREVPEARVELLPQTVAMPTQPDPATAELSVRAAHDGEVLAVRLEWEDPTEDTFTTVDRFGDQVAVQFPARHGHEPLPSPMMGHEGAPVRIMQWRGVLQHELAHGAPTIHDLYPNAVVDLYPDRLLGGEVAAPYGGGRLVGNPVSRPRLLSPVITQVAEGWGTLTDAADQPAGGAGVWHRGRWQVVITVPLGPAAWGEAALRPGLETAAAFAVWDGGAHEVGSRKAWSMWVPFRIEP